ncbi:MAG TPA: hypothetical protein VN408_01380 [Actinoplanes sp.]|nr:hypothetical protein [Actinoplanes sp.]
MTPPRGWSPASPSNADTPGPVHHDAEREAAVICPAAAIRLTGD